MTQNLRIVGKAINPSDSNVVSNYTIPDSTTNWDSNSTTQRAFFYNNYYGTYYSWATVTAGTWSTPTNQPSKSSICPKGWHLPTASEGEAFVSQYNYNSVQNSPVYLVLTGRYLGGNILHGCKDCNNYNGTVYGDYWINRSTQSCNAPAFRIHSPSTLLGSICTYAFHQGATVRCLSDD